MPNNRPKTRDQFPESPGEGRSFTENSGAPGLEGKSTRTEHGDGTSVPASDTTCSNERLLSIRTALESGFTTMGKSLTKAIKDCFATMADKVEHNLLGPEGSDLSGISESEELLGGKQKEREPLSIDSLLDKRAKAADDQVKLTFKGCSFIHHFEVSAIYS